MHATLLELFQLGGRKNYEFHYKMNDDKENILTLDNENKIIHVSIGEPENEGLPAIIKDFMEKLQ